MIEFRDDLAGVDWAALNAALAADAFDNGRTPGQLELSFRNSRHVCIAWAAGQVVGTARLLSDGVCNAYLVDVWTLTAHRRKGVAREMVQRLCTAVPGQHVYLQADEDVAEFYLRLGFAPQPSGLSKVVGEWLANDSR